MNTPETDELEYEQECNYQVAWEDHCRKFETDRNEARQQRDELMQLLIDATTEYDSEGYISTETLIASDKLISSIKSTQ